MSDLISRAALFNAIATAQDKADIFAAIQAAPAVDAMSVVHGHWERDSLRGYPICSLCGTHGIDKKWMTLYCPACGAKMDEEAIL